MVLQVIENVFSAIGNVLQVVQVIVNIAFIPFQILGAVLDFVERITMPLTQSYRRLRQ
jgi:hypothetical protein